MMFEGGAGGGLVRSAPSRLHAFGCSDLAARALANRVFFLS